MPESNHSDITIFGQTNYRNANRPFGIKRTDRRRHMYIIGKTGMGKTTLLENLIISDIINGEGCCYIDPHGDTAEKLLDFIPPHRINDVIYLNPADTEFPISFNVLEAVDEINKNFVASGLISVFKKLWADSWGPRLEYILRNAILSLLDYPGSTLLGIMRILVEREYRDKVVSKIKDPVVKSFWVNEYSKWNEKTLQEVISPIQNKVGQFLSNFLIRNIVGQVKSTIDLRDIMDNKKILILNLSKGRIGEDTMQLLGSMIVTKLYLAAMSRVDVPENERPDFYLYVDEFQNFANESFANILSEARKYRLNLIVAHQYIEQLPEEVVSAVFGNVGTLINFRIGASDAEKLVLEFAPFFTEEDLVNLPAFCIYLKLMIDGVASDPFSAATLPPLFDDYRTNNREKVIKVSRERYANPRSVVEDKINRWSSMDAVMNRESNNLKIEDLGQGEPVLSNSTISNTSISLSQLSRNKMTDRKKSPSPISKLRGLGEGGEKNKNNNFISRSTESENTQTKKESDIKQNPKDEKKFNARCSLCGVDFKIKFKPDLNKPTYCDDCFKKVREERRKKPQDRDKQIVMLEGLPVKDEVLKAPSISLNSLMVKKKPEVDSDIEENDGNSLKNQWLNNNSDMIDKSLEKTDN